MVASPEPPLPSSEDNESRSAVDALSAKLIEQMKEAGIGGGPPGPPADLTNTIHNEVTKLKATTVNSVALAFLIGGGVAPLVSWATTGVSPLQAVLGAVWLTTGMLLHYGARRILKALVS